MRKHYSFLFPFLLSLFILIPIATNVWGENYNLVDFSSIATGDEIIIIGTKSGTNYAMANTGNPPKPISTGISIASNTLTTDLTTITFKATKNSDGTITFVSTAGGTLYCIGDNNGVKIGTVSSTGNANFSFDTSVKRLKNPVTGTARWLGIYNTQDWRCYTSSSASNISGTTTTFYKKVTTSTTTYSVTWKVGGEVYTDGNPTTSVAKGSKVTTLPTAPSGDAIGACADTFVGWSDTELGSAAGQSAPDGLFTTAADAPAITKNTTFYAVFAKKGESEGGNEASKTSTQSSFSSVNGTFANDVNVSYASYKGGGTTAPAVNGGEIRLYQNSSGTTGGYVTVSVPEGCTITSASIKSSMATTTGYSIESFSSTPSKSDFVVSNYALSANGTYTVSGLDTRYVTFACFGTTSSARLYVSSLSVTYKSSGSSDLVYSDYVTSCGECQDLEPWSGLVTRDVAWNTATLEWDQPANVSGYKVTVTDKNAPADYNKTFTIDNANTTTLNLDGLTRGTEYQWTITAIPADGYCATPSAPQTFATKECTQLPAPTNLSVTYDEESGKYTFSWDKVEGATEYRMNGGFSGTIKGTSSTQALTRNPGEEYTQSVTAIGDNGQWCDGEPASITYNGHVFTLTLSVTDNGTTTTTEIKQPKCTLPTATSMCEALEGWTFAGWSETDITEESTTTAPALIAAGTEYAPDNGFIKSDKTLYAVFKKTEEGENAGKDGTTTLNLQTSSLTSPWTDSDGATWTFSGLNIVNGNNAGFKTAGTAMVQLPSGCIGELIAIATTGNSSASGVGLIVSSGSSTIKTLSSIANTTISLEGTQCAGTYTFKRSDSKTNVAYIKSIQITYKSSATILYTTSPSCIDCNDPNNNCPEYPLVLNDRGTETEAGTYWVGEEITKDEIANAYTPQGGCDGYTFAGWTTEAGLSNLTATEWERKMVTFPCKMPAKAAAEGQLTLYAVYSAVWTDEYRLVTDMDEMTTGEYVITAAGSGAKENALSFVRADYIENFGSQPVDITKDEDGIDIVSTTNPEIIWTLTETAAGNYTLEALHFDGMEKRSYLNIVGNYLQFEETAKPYTIEQGTGNTFTLCSPDGYCLSYDGQDFVAGETEPLHLYKRVKETRYSTSTACDPSIISVGTVAVTSAPGIWVEAVTQPYIFAERLKSNRDKAASVDIIATSKTAQFTLKPVGATGAGSASLTLKTGETRDNFADRFMVVYQPTRYNVVDEGTIEVKAVNAADHSKEYAVHTIRVKGRSLPEKFVIAAQTGNGWVALPADLGTSSLATLKAPYRITVDDDNDPAKAVQAPETAIYHAAARFDENTNPRGVHLMNSSGMRLCGDYSKDPDSRLWFDKDPVTNSQSWALRSLALKDYYIRLQAAPAGNYLFYNATEGGKIGYYTYQQKNRLRLRLLPVEEECTRYDAPVVQVAQLQSESVTLEWQDVQNGVEYEYTLDGGDTWTTFGTEHGWEVKNGVNTATISGLTPEKDYTVSVRVAVGEGQNCSEEGTRTFTMPLCDDVPHHLWATATADAVTVIWNAESPTATVRLYSDEAGTHTVAEDTGAESPHSIKGLTQNTKYWYQVLADGTCASAIASFTTESNDISIVEWEKEAVIVDINTEVADGVSVVVEKRVEHGAGNQNIADDLFFSKYYEASGNVKLLGIYNGTKETISLQGMTIHLGTVDKGWEYSVIDLSMYTSIAPNEEIILWTKGTTDPNSSSYKTDQAIINCVENSDIDMATFKELSMSILQFSGKQSFALCREDLIIDIIGAASFLDTNTDKNVTISGTKPAEGSIKPVWTGTVAEGETKPTWGDKEGWVGSGYSQDDPTKIINLSTNRCLLVRGKVKSGADAVAKNISEEDPQFVTLGSYSDTGQPTEVGEWSGRQVLKISGVDNNGVQSSCAGFAYVADFDYNDYYTTFEGMDTVKIDGQKNPNGTYTIPVERLDTLACNDIRLQLTKNGEVTASVEQKVPIIVDKTTHTQDATYFPASLTEEICSTCDVVVRGEQKLTHNTGARKFRNMYIYHGSRLEIDPAAAIQLEKLRMFALNDDVSYAIVNNSAKEGEGSTSSIYVKEISHVKRIDGQYWYPFSLPYNCYIKDISALNGRELGEYGMDWGIKYYDGQKRQAAGKSAAAGQTSDFWYMMPADGMLEAYKGYIIGLFTGDEKHQKSINFAPANINTYTETADSKTTYVENWTDNLEAAARHHGWNFTGSPYISLFGSNEEEQGLNNANLQMGRTNPETGEQEETDFVYVSIPDGADSRTYTQQLASATQVKPFSAYFVQAVDPAGGAAEPISLTYSKANRSLPEQAANPTLAPRRASSRDEVLFAELVLRASGNAASGMSDNAGVLVSNRFSTEYEIGYDLTKMYAAADKPQLYTLASDNEKMAYNAVPDLLGQHVPLGIYVPSAGDYTLSLNPSASRLEHAESVLLLYNGGIAANLLTGDYTLSAAGKGSVSGYSLDIRRSREIATDTEASAVGMTGVGVQNGELVLLNLPGDADVAVYDMLGRVLLSTRTTGDTPQISVPDLPTGIYTAVVTTAENQQIFKTMLR